MTYFPSVVLAATLVYVLGEYTHSLLGPQLGAVVDLVVFIAIVRFTNKFLKNLKEH